ncbi:HlyD family efflux transporter periplasmic adaptor subunit [Clostridium estertheticum]|uniref:HlyD family efflux transporter periplasmic adaptor subunit n=1 Tax=Clostridium estertheticum TaxID=238834 RepID=A0AA47EK36_9CLOT|nr:HlyD family efflux transporter periplasmic adaptor subunit [Clostridium estertheticum]MBU3155415.1 HlyD family efflux transporter periplasmic adaptor subunit [Clostridium estertheticum]MBU3199485.1 HlyD family efflux transporter periplasmic adaptor subunit [Clostridium estertheticum]WAG60486.1 HlyD family efflux transporter periplasmic adaptor subunit [Clostridium estertheticum]WAG65437.1 HlyD family efflux transporter periplasmic adaptor subunit [Clostridium estertheticum]
MKSRRKFLLSSVVVVLILALVYIVGHYWYENTYYISTDDAKVTGDFIKAVPHSTGRLLKFNVKEGDFVSKDQILGYIDANSAAANIRAPISGTIVKVVSHVGDYVSSSQLTTLALIVDTKKIYINANIEETKINKIHPGQSVDVTVDEYVNKKFIGRVESIGQASESVFAITQSSTSGTYTKVARIIPVKIELNKNDVSLLTGTNATVKIHIK